MGEGQFIFSVCLVMGLEYWKVVSLGFLRDHQSYFVSMEIEAQGQRLRKSMGVSTGAFET